MSFILLGILNSSAAESKPAVEGGTVFEINLLNPLCFEPRVGLQRLRNGFFRRNGARLERDHNRVGIDGLCVGRHPNRLHGAHAGADQVVGQVGGAGEVVGNATEQGLVGR